MLNIARLSVPWLVVLLGAPACGNEAQAPSDSTGGHGGSGGSSVAGGPATGGTAADGGMDSGGAADGGQPPTPLRGRCAVGTRTGDFSAVLEPDVTTVRGQVWDKPARSRILTEVARNGDCWLTKSENPRCSPSCSGTETCSADGVCVPVPISRSVGDVSILGLARPVKMSPLMPGNNYFVAGEFPAHGFEPGAAVLLEAVGADLKPFTLSGIGVAQLELPEAAWLLERDEPFVVTWNAGAVPEAVVRVAFNVDQHGTAPLVLGCETKDDGELSIDAGLINALLDAGVTGFPSGHVNRETVDSVRQGDACVELAIGAHVRRGLKVAGYTACVRQSDCPDGQTCNLQLQRCE